MITKMTQESCATSTRVMKKQRKTVDAFASVHKLKAKENIFEVWISKINIKPDGS